jgi:hypothetical protein
VTDQSVEILHFVQNDGRSNGSIATRSPQLSALVVFAGRIFFDYLREFFEQAYLTL